MSLVQVNICLQQTGDKKEDTINAIKQKIKELGNAKAR
jgi:hypothetical protein